VSSREPDARLQQLIEELRKTTHSSEELAAKVAAAIRAERRIGLPYAQPKPVGDRPSLKSARKRKKT